MTRQGDAERPNLMMSIIEFTQLIDPKFVPFDKQIEDYLDTLDNEQLTKYKMSKQI